MASLDNQHPTVTRQLTYLFLTLFYLDSLIGLLVFIDQMSKKLTFLDFLAPYDQWLALADVAIFGWLAIGSGSIVWPVGYRSAGEYGCGFWRKGDHRVTSAKKTPVPDGPAAIVRLPTGCILRIVATGVLVCPGRPRWICTVWSSASRAALLAVIQPQVHKAGAARR